MITTKRNKIFTFNNKASNFNLNLLLAFFFINSTTIAQNINQKKIDSLQINLIKTENSLQKKAILYGLIAEEYQVLEQKKSMEFAEKLFLASKKINYEKGIADYYRISAKNYNSIGQYTNAIINAENSNKISLKLKDTLNYLINLNTISDATNGIGDIDNAITTALKGVNYTKNKKFSLELGDLNFILCVLNNIKNNLDKSFLYINEAEKWYNKSKLKAYGLSKCYQQLSQLYLKNNKNDKAIDYSLKSLAIAKKNNFHENALSILYTSAGIAYFNNFDDKEAISYLIKADEINKKYGSNERRAFNLVMLSQVYFGFGEFDNVIKKSNMAISLSKDNHTKFMAYATIGSSFTELENYELALINQLKAKDLISKINDVEHQRRIYFEISNTYKKLEDYKNAYEYLNKYQELEISFLNKIQEKSINELEIKYDTKQKELDLKDLTILAQKDKTLIVQKENQKNILISIILLGIFLGIISFFLYKKIKRKNKELEDEKRIVFEANTKLNKSLDQNALLLKEIHHRVKNNLQIIMSLLNIQANSKKKINIDDFIENAQTRISSMSLIHQNLYENEKLDHIDFEKYIKKLTQNLLSVFGIETQNIVLKIKAQNIFLDIQTAIPLGLILNELFSNTLKYAFNDFKNAEITIEIKAEGNNQYCLIFADNGKGYNDTNKHNNSMGLELVNLLILQLKGNIEKQNSAGTYYIIKFKAIDIMI